MNYDSLRANSITVSRSGLLLAAAIPDQRKRRTHRRRGRQSACQTPMPSKHLLLFRIGTLAIAFSAILGAQVPISPKLPNPRTYKGPTCSNCVRDLSGHISQNPVPVRKFRSTHPCPANGSLEGACPGYVVDYKKPLDRGGKDTVQNMRWRTVAQATKERAKMAK
jgi:hypothetical protein